MGNVECTTTKIECKPRSIHDDSGEGDIGMVTDDPYILGDIVRKSWKKIKTERPADAPAPDPSNPMTLIPVTFAEMFNFNIMVLNKDGTNMDFKDAFMNSMPDLVENCNNPMKIKVCCATLGKELREKGATPAGLMMYKSAMMASLRGLLAADGWDNQHEAAWYWFYEQVKRQLQVKVVTVAQLVQSSWEAAGAGLMQNEALGPMMIPRNFEEMAGFNSLVLSKEGGPDLVSWTKDLYAAMPSLVKVAEDSAALSQECDGLAPTLKAAGCTAEAFKGFEVVTLASMRSLSPTTWDAQYEAAWSSFWKTVAGNVCPKL